MTKETKPRKNPYAKAIAAYYQALKDFEFQNAFHEGATRAAFQTLLADAGRSHMWALTSPMRKKRRCARGNCRRMD